MVYDNNKRPENVSVVNGKRVVVRKGPSTQQVGEPTKKRTTSRKSWGATLTLCILLGIIGYHRFYVGKPGTAILMLLTLGGFGIWVLIDLIVIISGNFKDGNGKKIVRR